MDVVGADQRNAGLLTEPLEQGIGAFLFGQVMVLHLQIVAPVVEDGGEPKGALLCFLVLVIEQVLQDFSTQACREADDPFVVLCQQFIVDARLEVKTLYIGE
ncbi:hypothetical protein SDC9_205240 [bioreactor metagenome]|uniref:Uncharacterized protein n=1 Tax=bioreactor metagenome TaxID=1076179 RepID=A0A645J270_9ZZZZ